MSRLVDRSAPVSRIRPIGLRLYAAMAAVLGLLTIPVAGAHAQDLTKYASSNISVFASSTTAGSNGQDGIPATSASFAELTVAVDSANNVYFANASNSVRMVYVGGPVPPLLQFALAVNATLGNGPTTANIGDVYTIVNIQNAQCVAGTACGDGGQAGIASMGTPWGLAFDSAGNLFIADLTIPSVRKVSVADGTISTVVGDPLHSSSTYNGDNIPAVGAYLTAPTFLALDASNNLFIADSGSNLVRRVDASTQVITTVAGNNTTPGTFCSDNVCGEGGLATAANLGTLNSVAANAAGDLFLAESSENVVRKVDHATGKIATFAGQLGVACADTSCGGEGVAATTATLNYPYDVSLDASGNVIITDQNDNAIRGVLSDGTIRTLAGTLNQAPGIGPLTGPASGAQFYNPYAAVIDGAGNLFIADVNNNVMWKVNAPVALTAQTITFNQIPNATYGNPAIDLTRYATTDSGLAISFTCTGPVTCSGTNNATLMITGAGSVTVTANQAGDATYGPATLKTSTFTVARAALTVKADNISFPYKSAAQLPPLTYTYAGFVNGDAATTAVTGTPTLTTTATATSLVGQYPITVALGTLASANYSFTLANGTLSITGGVAQTITFNPLPNVTYGVATFTLGATASSGGAVTYTVSGPAQLLGAALTVTGAGTVSVTANQAGSAQYGPATPVTQSFQVAPAVLNIAAQPMTRAYNTANPAFTFLATGFVSADNVSVLSGAPAFATTATQTSVPGSYPVTISQGTLFAGNYTFTFTNSTLTVGKAPQTITFAAIPSQPFGGTGVPLSATASSGLPVTFSVASPSTISGNTLITVAPGSVTVTADQPGNDLYQPALSVSQIFVAQKINVDIFLTQTYTIPFGAAIPTFTYQFGTGFTLPANLYSGAPDIATTATSTSPPGTYPIIVAQGTLFSADYNFIFHNGTLTILSPATFILTANPASVTIPSGQARQVTITLTPVNGFVGSVTIGCTGLPAGVTCVSSPNELTTTFGTTGSQTVMGTLTISAGAPVASAQIQPGKSNISFAGWLWLPSLLLGGLLAVQRRRFFQNTNTKHLFLLALLLLSASGLIACGSSSGSNTLKPGTTTIQVTGAGTSTSGPATASVALSVTIQ